MNKRALSISLLFAGLFSLSGCSTTTGEPATPEARRASIDASVDEALGQLYAQVKGSKEMVDKSRGVLVFPKVVAAGLVVAGSHGDGALRRTAFKTDYYSTSSASVGLTVGAQSKAVYVLFLTDEAMDKFIKGDGWTAGVDANVALLKVGTDGSVDIATARAPVVGFVLTNGGLMANLSLEGTKVKKLML